MPIRAWITIIVGLGLFAANPAAAAGRLLNLSTRGMAGNGADALTAGFVVRGTGNKKLLLRAAGPAWGAFGVNGTLAETRLELFQGPTLLASNTRWDSGADAATVAQARSSRRTRPKRPCCAVGGRRRRRRVEIRRNETMARGACGRMRERVASI